MSDSGRTIGQCRHGRDHDECWECWQAEALRQRGAYCKWREEANHHADHAERLAKEVERLRSEVESWKKLHDDALQYADSLRCPKCTHPWGPLHLPRDHADLGTLVWVCPCDCHADAAEGDGAAAGRKQSPCRANGCRVAQGGGEVLSDLLSVLRRYLEYLDSHDGRLLRRFRGGDETDGDLTMAIPTPPGISLVTVGDLRSLLGEVERLREYVGHQDCMSDFRTAGEMRVSLNTAILARADLLAEVERLKAVLRRLAGAADTAMFSLYSRSAEFRHVAECLREAKESLDDR